MQSKYIPCGIEANFILRQPLCKSAALLAHISHLRDDVSLVSVLRIVALPNIFFVAHAPNV